MLFCNYLSVLSSHPDDLTRGIAKILLERHQESCTTYTGYPVPTRATTRRPLNNPCRHYRHFSSAKRPSNDALAEGISEGGGMPCSSRS